MHLVDLNDLNLFRRILGYQDTDNWNRAVKAYMNEFYPDANLRFVSKEYCWKVTNSELTYHVDVKSYVRYVFVKEYCKIL